MRMRLRERRSSTAEGISLLSNWQSRAKPIIGRPETPRFGETNLCRRSRDSTLRSSAHTDYLKHKFTQSLKNRFNEYRSGWQRKHITLSFWIPRYPLWTEIMSKRNGIKEINLLFNRLYYISATCASNVIYVSCYYFTKNNYVPDKERG